MALCPKGKSLEPGSLYSIWYCVLAIIAYFYLVVDAVRRYNYYAELPWPEESKPSVELFIYLALIALSLIYMVAFVPCQLIKTGNNANDEEKLGEVKPAQFDMGFNTNKSEGRLRKVWKHYAPVGPTLHILAAFCLLFPKILLEAKEIKHGFKSPEYLWQTELNVIFGSSEDVNNLDNDSDSYIDSYTTMNMLNLFVPLFFYAIRYPEVFWRTHKYFGFLFSVYLMLATVDYMVSFSSFAVVYKVTTYGWNASGLTGEPVFHRITGAVVHYLGSMAMLFVSPLIYYSYGFLKLQEKIRGARLAEKPAEIVASFGRWKRLSPFIAIFVCYFFFACWKSALLWEYHHIYKATVNTHPSVSALMLGAIVFDALYLGFWLFVWIAFAVKKEWDFELRHENGGLAINSGDQRLATTNSVARLVGEAGVEMTIVNSGTKHVVTNLAKQEAILKALKANGSNTSLNVDQMTKQPDCNV